MNAPEPPQLPRLTAAHTGWMREVQVMDADGQSQTIRIPVEQPLTLFVDKHELVTLMTLGQMPELLVLGYLLNQRIVGAAADVESITVDWGVQAAAVHTRGGVESWRARTERRVVTTGCGLGTAFGDLHQAAEGLQLRLAPESMLTQARLERVLEGMRLPDSVHRQAGSVHGTALWGPDGRRLFFVEDVGRHNAVDSLSGWMALHRVPGGDKILYTTGRLSSEMVLKAAQLGVPVLVSRNGVTAMGHELAERMGLTLIGRAGSRRFICYSGAQRLPWLAGR